MHIYVFEAGALWDWKYFHIKTQEMRYWSWLLKSPSITQSVNQKLLIILKNKRKCQNENTQAHNYHENPPGLLWFSPHMPLIIASGENNFFFHKNIWDMMLVWLTKRFWARLNVCILQHDWHTCLIFFMLRQENFFQLLSDL